MYRIRLHGRGGQGIKTAAQILGSAFFLSGFEVQDAPRYGAERRGAPVLATLRAARQPIDERGAIVRADLLLVADETLFQVPVAGVLQGADADTVLLMLGVESAARWRERLAFAGRIFMVPPDDEEAHPAIPLIGAAARMSGVISAANLEQALRHELSGFGAARVQTELRRAMHVYLEFSEREGALREAPAPSAESYAHPDWVALTAEAARSAAPVIRAGANSAGSRTGFWRTQRPVIDYQRCGRCSWICSTLCPDSAIKVGADRSPVIDYEHCKGCLVCVTVCPPHAITVMAEQSAVFAAAAPGVAP